MSGPFFVSAASSSVHVTFFGVFPEQFEDAGPTEATWPDQSLLPEKVATMVWRDVLLAPASPLDTRKRISGAAPDAARAAPRIVHAGGVIWYPGAISKLAEIEHRADAIGTMRAALTMMESGAGSYGLWRGTSAPGGQSEPLDDASRKRGPCVFRASAFSMSALSPGSTDAEHPSELEERVATMNSDRANDVGIDMAAS